MQICGNRSSKQTLKQGMWTRPDSSLPSSKPKGDLLVLWQKLRNSRPYANLRKRQHNSMDVYSKVLSGAYSQVWLPTRDVQSQKCFGSVQIRLNFGAKKPVTPNLAESLAHPNWFGWLLAKVSMGRFDRGNHLPASPCLGGDGWGGNFPCQNAPCLL